MGAGGDLRRAGGGALPVRLEWFLQLLEQRWPLGWGLRGLRSLGILGEDMKVGPIDG